MVTLIQEVNVNCVKKIPPFSKSIHPEWSFRQHLPRDYPWTSALFLMFPHNESIASQSSFGVKGRSPAINRKRKCKKVNAGNVSADYETNFN